MSHPVQETRFDYKDYPCVVLFQPMGFRCGYVGIPKTHHCYYKEYDDIPVDCHCGLTYANDRLFGQKDLDTWWIGFDCGHCCDAYDVPKMKEYFADDEAVQHIIKINEANGYYDIFADLEVRSLEYCIEQCKKIVDQLEE